MALLTYLKRKVYPCILGLNDMSGLKVLYILQETFQ